MKRAWTGWFIAGDHSGVSEEPSHDELPAVVYGRAVPQLLDSHKPLRRKR
jgi:hypothetical protein